ncbi:hypothetical protein PRB20_000046 [Salmonella enterica]|nr:hypothetical protein [Salmonella enterica]EAW1261836.1 hypothetical protein [Salmonella enterica subsp. diarizonae]EEG1121479.1 hypothetical protein [Salmonella enterica subsp. diarizonae]EGU4505557.1 hypothetical protein [Salmonella enterica]EKK4208758.1 hypothetical protein [Salmonella enterica]
MGIFTGSPVLGTGAGESTGGGTGGGLSSVKTDGKTITGDGNTTPLALGPGEPFVVGSYVLANFDGIAVYNGYDGVIKGEQLEIDKHKWINTIVHGGHLYLANALGSFTPYTMEGTWICCSPVDDMSDNRGIWRRIA